MAHAPRISSAQRAALAELSRGRLGDRVYLAGGIAVAMHFDHRPSRDLDLFSRKPTLSLAAVRRELSSAFGARMEVVARTTAAMHVLIDGLDVDIVRYPYPTLEPPIQKGGGLAVASVRDLAAMKLSAIATRGIKRDFWDLAVLLTSPNTSLASSLDDYSLKFGVDEADRYHVLRALVWFDDAEREAVMPTGLTEKRWRDLKAFFRREVQALDQA